MHLGRVLSGGLVVFFFFFCCSSLVWCTCGYIVWLNWGEWGVCLVVGWHLAHMFMCVCACVYFSFKHYENICILLSPACVALIISCMHQGSLPWRSHGASHITRRGRRRSSSPAACHSQRALLQQRQRGEEHPGFSWLQIALDPQQRAYWH